jgi:hypothetical protein
MGFVGDKIEDLKHFLAEGYPLPDYNQTFGTLRPNSTLKPNPQTHRRALSLQV